MVVDVRQFISNNVQFRFVGSRGQSFTGDMAIDDFKLENGNTCVNPSVYQLANTDTSASFYLVGGGFTYNIEWGQPGFTPGNGCQSIVGSGVFNLNKFTDSTCGNLLKGSQVYDLYVWNECNTDKMKLTFNTACPGFTAPYHNNFDLDPLWAAPACWQLQLTGASVGSGAGEVYKYLTASSSPHHTRVYNGGGQSSGDSTLLISPRFEDLNDTDKQLRFAAKAHENGISLLVGSLADPQQPGTFVAIDTLLLTTSYQTYVVSLTGSGSTVLITMWPFYTAMIKLISYHFYR
ncbi:MAG: hypothetical protein U5L96_03120 [Owenweeksia sp.]|nr:hypothetical protein [Owenweeksia sp.]